MSNPSFERDLCGNCGQWREMHYDVRGDWRGEDLETPCVEYFGVMPTEKRRKEKQKDLEAYIQTQLYAADTDPAP